MKNKFKSYGFWTALAGAVVVLVNALGQAFGFNVDNELVSNIIMAIAGVLVVFGVVSMPKKDDADFDNKDENMEDFDEQETDNNLEMDASRDQKDNADKDTKKD